MPDYTALRHAPSRRAFLSSGLRRAASFAGVLACLTACTVSPITFDLGGDALDGGLGSLCEMDGGCVPIAGEPACPDCAGSECELATCDGIVCTVRDEADGQPCSSGGVCVSGACVARGCGDGFLEPGPSPAREACDDGNTVSDDGCSATCVPERLTVALIANRDAGATVAEWTSTAVDGEGTALVAWLVSRNDARELSARRFSRNGNAIDAATASILIAGIPGSGDDIRVSLAGRPGGGWVVAWSAPGADADGLGVRMVLIEADGSVGPARQVALDQNGDQLAPAVAAASGVIAVAWVDRRVPHEAGEVGQVLLRHFDGAGVATAVPEMVSTLSVAAGEPALLARDGSLVVGWSEGPRPGDPSPDAFTSRVVVRRRAASAWIDPAPVAIAEGRASSPALAWRDTGDVVAAWVSRAVDPRGNIEVRTLGAAGSIDLGAVSTFATTAGTRSLEQLEPQIAGLARGAYLGGWEQDERAPTIAVSDPAPSAIVPEDLTRFRAWVAGRAAASIALARAPRGVWVAWTDAVVGGRAVRAHLLPYADSCRLCGGASPFCDAVDGTCYQCDVQADCPVLLGTTRTCAAGACVYQCTGGHLDCDANQSCEIDGAVDPANCGACGTVCGANEECDSGTCECSPGFTRCGGVCVNLTTDVDHCGSCGTVCAALPGVATSWCPGGACGFTCAANREDCNGSWEDACEVDTSTSTTHCGGCGIACGLNEICNAGVCACDSGFNECPSDPVCLSRLSDDQNCSASCVDCTTLPNAYNGACAGGACNFICAGDYQSCDGAWQNGCETDVKNDVENCGDCGYSCFQGEAVDDATCASGTCELVCKEEFGDCDADAQNGCESYLIENPEHCGACGNFCDKGDNVYEGYCAGDVCELECLEGYGDCDVSGATGCEAYLPEDDYNCHECGNSCVGQANSSGGHCDYDKGCILDCESQYENCDQAAFNGCEINGATNLQNCGGCGRSCLARPNSTSATCSSGSCNFTCSGSYRDCDSASPTGYANGCETNTSSSATNCGACGNSCLGRPHTTGGTCSGSSCNITCSGYYRNCDGNYVNGCELYSYSNNTNCGACGNTCLGRPNSTGGSCSGTTCNLSCSGWYRNCDGVASNGCERYVYSNSSHCGACGNSCTGRPNTTGGSCSGTTCNITCSAGYANCDGVTSNGCEGNLASNQHCGGCGNTCGSGQYCASYSWGRFCMNLPTFP